jgi:DNA polymerase (family 10)
LAADPTNLEIAAAFDELADLYELDGAVVHRVMAYRGAAKSAREASSSIAGLTRAGRVTELPGIGKTLEEKLTALLETGAIPAAEKLRARYPPGLMEMMRLPGLGPKRARRLFEELGIESLEMLRAAAQEQKLREAKGFGPKFEASVLSALEAGAGEAPAQRVLLHRALDIGDAIVAALREHSAAERVELAGSARRSADSVKDLDIIATASDPAALTSALAELYLI